MKKILAVSFLFLLGSTALARYPYGGVVTSGGVINNGGGTPASCGFGIQGDGCTAGQTETVSGIIVPGPPTASAYTVPASGGTNTWASLFRSGQTPATTGGCSTGYASCHPAWNVAGVDYPVGIDASVAGSLKDPSTNPPTGCTYAASVLTCSALNIDIEGYNFGVTAAGCVITVIGDVAPFNGTLVIKNNYFRGDGACIQGAANAIISNNGSVFSGGITISNNYFDGLGDSGGNQKMYTGGSSTGSVVVEYNAFLHARTEPISLSGANMTILFNYIDGFDYPLSDPSVHDHMFMVTGNGGTTTNSYAGYNTMVPQVGSLGGTAYLYFQASGAIYTNQWLYNSIYVGNTGGTSNTAIGICWRSQCSNVHLNNNFVDYRAMANCAAVEETTAGSPFTIPLTSQSGNVEIESGSSWNSMFKTDNTGNGFFTSGGASAGNPC